MNKMKLTLACAAISLAGLASSYAKAEGEQPVTVSKLSSIAASQVAGGEARVAAAAATASASAFHLYTLNGMTRINNSYSVKSAYGAYKNSVNDRAGATVVAGLAAALIAHAIELERGRNKVVEIYNIPQRNRAVDLLADAIVSEGRDNADFDEAIEELRKDPKPEYGQLFIDATLLSVNACNTVFRGHKDGWLIKIESRCKRIMAVAKEAGLPTEIDDGTTPDAAKFLPQPVAEAVSVKVAEVTYDTDTIKD